MSVRILTALVPLALGTFIVLHYDLAANAAAYVQNFPFTGLVPATPNSRKEPQPYTRHIVAVGDLHGDWMNARKVLHFSGVINDQDEWSGDVDFFAQTGDIIDRGPDTIKLFTFMDELRAQAQAQGDVVLSMLGNHEWMNALGDWRYVYPTELATFDSVKARQTMLSTGAIGRSWASNYTTASRLPLHPSLGPPNTPYPSQHEGPLSHSALSFVHGGLSPSYSNLSPFPSKINEISDSLLRKLQSRDQPDPHPPGPYAGLPADATHDEQELYGSNGPLWYRGWAQDTEAAVCKDVEGVLQKTGTRRMIMGHTPDFDNITSRCGGKIIIIDTGISRAYGGVLSALSIHYTLEPIGKALTLDEQEWQEREVVSALYEDRQEILADDTRRVVGNFATP
ncbi:Metallo-dependent phosphatase [Cylindrobasidium torrendii FP15055 ss-10]|uniref:Metallo-dependent phosphatase n=1 Tax=Cylindrobasidium torrendii FP15055 ss-10 TaxID=1314674 RepID=A0A0D7B4W7_9AGAR|nr:Metallo-dependent phosphatase [Cylindrobasidium torrendii FP15055 ss-10]